MADKDIAELKQFELTNVKFTGKKLGEGSYGSVEVVEIPGAKCAAKTIHELLVQFMPTQSVQSKDYTPRSLIEGFITECTLMSKLKHPHIVQFMGISYPPGAKLPALVMELLMTSLHEYLESAADIPMSIKHNILLGVSKGVVFLHSLDVVHRDLTARNVLLSTSLDAKIADLGMARLLNIQVGRHAATMTKGPGNACYMPPEAKDGDVVRYGKPIDTFSLGNLILFTITQDFPNPKNPTYFDTLTRSTKARTEIERRETSFQLLWEMIGKDHALSFIANRCLQDNPNLRPTAPEIVYMLEKISTIPYRDWSASKHDLVQSVLGYEQTLCELRDKNDKLAREHTRDVQTISQLRYVEFKQQKELMEKNLLLEKMHPRESTRGVMAGLPKVSSKTKIKLNTSKTKPKRQSQVAIPSARDEIVKAILSIQVSSSQPLRMVQVPPKVIEMAKAFVTSAPNCVVHDMITTNFRFKILYRMPSGHSIYDLLIADADSTTLDVADSKITGWQEACATLIRYALNLLLAPKHRVFQEVKLNSSYYAYRVSKKLKGAEEILEAMGYERVTGSQEVQELKYKGDVNSRCVAETAADLVILHGELARVKELVASAQKETQSITLTNILQARSHPTEILEHAIQTAARYASQSEPPISLEKKDDSLQASSSLTPDPLSLSELERSTTICSSGDVRTDADSRLELGSFDCLSGQKHTTEFRLASNHTPTIPFDHDYINGDVEDPDFEISLPHDTPTIAPPFDHDYINGDVEDFHESESSLPHNKSTSSLDRMRPQRPYKPLQPSIKPLRPSTRLPPTRPLPSSLPTKPPIPKPRDSRILRRSKTSDPPNTKDNDS